MIRVLYIYGGPEFHPTQWAGEKLKEFAAEDGRFEIDTTDDLDSLSKLPGGKFDVVVDYTTFFNDDLAGARADGLFGFVKNGGGYVALHSAADSFRGNRAYVEMIDGEFLTHPEQHEFSVNIKDHDHYITTRMPDFPVFDELYHLQNHDPSKVALLASTPYRGEEKPMLYVREYGKGRVVYVAPGHTYTTWKNSDFQKLVIRSMAWASGVDKPEKQIRCGILGYGPAFNMGKYHADAINATKGLVTTAVCDANPDRVAAAKADMPGLSGYHTCLNDLLKNPEVDLVVDILPHNLHAQTAIQCLNAGKHVVVEKPFCITVAEANAMIDAYVNNNVMLSIFHNRRWDPDYLLIREVAASGMIGDIFHIEAGFGSYSHPGFWWRSDKAVSGGVMHDWGAHFIDWILNLVPSKITQVNGDFRKLVWNAVTNEDHGQAIVRFENGTTADILASTIWASVRPRWRILGTKGSLTALNEEYGTFELVSHATGVPVTSKVKPRVNHVTAGLYYRNIADHLLMGEKLEVKAEHGRRTIAIIEAAMKSSELGHSVPVAGGCE